MRDIYFDLKYGDAVDAKGTPSYLAVVKFGRIVEIKLAVDKNIIFKQKNNWLDTEISLEKDNWRRIPWSMFSLRQMVLTHIFKHPFEKTNYFKQLPPGIKYYTFWKKSDDK